ncbi:hypothetical protein SLA2020_505930 [Shorea laevis]
MASNFKIRALFAMILIIINRSTLAIDISSLTLDLGLGEKLSTDPGALESASRDYGHIVTKTPTAVLKPALTDHIATLIKSAYHHSTPFGIAAKGCGHSVRGQAMVSNGVVISMTSLKNGVIVSGNSSSGFVADVGSEQLWIDVLEATLKHGLAPVSWTDYLYITVGGTLSNAGISGQTFRSGPQISNVYEVDVITGEGQLLTCTAKNNSELFHAVLGGLGQFGIITRARIPLEPAPQRVKWVRMLYSDFSAFTGDQERLISINGRKDDRAVDYVEGSLLMGSSENWRSSFFHPANYSIIISLITTHGIIYSLEVVKYYNDQTRFTVDEELQLMLKGLNYIPGLVFEKDVSYINFLNRVHAGEEELRSQGLWEVPHPWLNLFIPKSQIENFNEGVFRNIVLKRNMTSGLVLVYPMNRNKWDDMMSAVIPYEDVFYTVGFLRASGFDNWEVFDDQNSEILKFCDEARIEVKQYLPHYTTKEDWMKHFGPKWKTFVERKSMFDPKSILSPGQGIFNSS